MNEIPITIVGRVVADPELKFTPNGHAVCTFRLATNARKFNKTTNSWENASTSWFRVSVWRQAAENAAQTYHQGDAVIVVGTYSQREWENKDGVKQVSNEIEATAVGPDTTWATAVISRNSKSGSSAGSSAGTSGGYQPPAAPATSPDPDPFGMGSDEPPF